LCTVTEMLVVSSKNIRPGTRSASSAAGPNFNGALDTASLQKPGSQCLSEQHVELQDHLLAVVWGAQQGRTAAGERTRSRAASSKRSSASNRRNTARIGRFASLYCHQCIYVGFIAQVRGDRDNGLLT
jgi:hypothetical protein